jgi:hypothetical protein
MSSRKSILAVSLAAILLLPGCFVLNPKSTAPTKPLDNLRTVTQARTQQLDSPSVQEVTAQNAAGPQPLYTDVPFSVDAENLPPSWELSLDDVIKIGLDNARVLRDMGASILRSPSASQTIHDPAIQASDPRFGMEGALAAFDAQLESRFVAQNNDRAFNNPFLSGGAFLFSQDLDNWDTQLTKQTAAGTFFAVRHHVDYDFNNAPANLFPSVFNTNYEGEIRQPLLQGAGTDFNRIAGPRGVPGQINGVVIAQINSKLSTADFEIGLRDFISNLENAYWDLYYAYRELDAKIAARDTALKTWRIIHANVMEQRGYSKLQEVQTLEQYYRFQEEVLDALGGRNVDRTRTYNGSSGGTFRGIGGVYAAERRLRQMLGLPISDGRLIRPCDEPPQAKVSFDWEKLVQETMIRRPELRRQKAMVERANKELCATQNFLLPRLDVLGKYRFRGFGHDWFGANYDPANPYQNAFGNLTSGQFQEWEMGVEYSMPLGFRKEHAAVRNAEFKCAREKAVLCEQERQATHDLASVYAEVQRSFAFMQVAQNRFATAQEQFDRAYDAFFELGGKVSLELVLDARIRLVDAEMDYRRSRVDYALSLKNVHYEKGSLLDYNGACLIGDGCQGLSHRSDGVCVNKETNLKNYVISDNKLRPREPAAVPPSPKASPLVPETVSEAMPATAIPVSVQSIQKSTIESTTPATFTPILLPTLGSDE